jgi:hypothetical protein
MTSKSSSSESRKRKALFVLLEHARLPPARLFFFCEYILGVFQNPPSHGQKTNTTRVLLFRGASFSTASKGSAGDRSGVYFVLVQENT